MILCFSVLCVLHSKIQVHDTKTGYLRVPLVVHGCKISFSKPAGHSLNKNMTYVLLLIIIIHQGNQTWEW